MGRELARQNGACWRCAKRVVDGCKKSGPLRASKKCVFLKKGAIWKENWLSRLEWSGRRNGLSILSLLSLKKTRGRKTTLLFCFLFSVSCVFYITGFFQLDWFFPILFYILAFLNYIGFSQLYYIYWLFPIILYFSPIILYFSPIVFIQLP